MTVLHTTDWIPPDSDALDALDDSRPPTAAVPTPAASSHPTFGGGASGGAGASGSWAERRAADEPDAARASREGAAAADLPLIVDPFAAEAVSASRAPAQAESAAAAPPAAGDEVSASDETQGSADAGDEGPATAY